MNILLPTKVCFVKIHILLFLSFLLSFQIRIRKDGLLFWIRWMNSTAISFKISIFRKLIQESFLISHTKYCPALFSIGPLLPWNVVLWTGLSSAPNQAVVEDLRKRKLLRSCPSPRRILYNSRELRMMRKNLFILRIGEKMKFYLLIRFLCRNFSIYIIFLIGGTNTFFRRN